MGYQQEHVSALAIVPARWASTRLPGKPLAMIGERPMVEWVYRGAEAALGQAVVATDDQRIYDAVRAFGGRAVMTSPSHQSGTDRCAEALELLKAEGIDPEVVVNVQGDEPFVNAQNLRRLVAEFSDSEVAIATLVRYFAQGEDEAEGDGADDGNDGCKRHTAQCDRTDGEARGRDTDTHDDGGEEEVHRVVVVHLRFDEDADA